TAGGREAAAAVLARAAAAVAEATGIALTAGGGEPPAWGPAARAELQLTVPGQDPFLFTTLIAPPLAASLAPVPVDAAETAAAAAEPAEEVAAAPAATPAEGPAAPEPAEPAGESEEFPSLEKLGLLLDVPLDVTLRFGARQMILKDILELGPGGVIELDRGVQEPVDLMVAGRVVATGEVVIVDGNYGLRVGRIASPRQRLSGLL
ncbi:MAG: FliM/FliN family flagellar motor switch protein, partial [Terriglobales bacterium]